jgi:hypothetical protein
MKQNINVSFFLQGCNTLFIVRAFKIRLLSHGNLQIPYLNTNKMKINNFYIYIYNFQIRTIYFFRKIDNYALKL